MKWNRTEVLLKFQTNNSLNGTKTRDKIQAKMDHNNDRVLLIK